MRYKHTVIIKSCDSHVTYSNLDIIVIQISTLRKCAIRGDVLVDDVLIAARDVGERETFNGSGILYARGLPPEATINNKCIHICS